jgi:hypothetical protein
MQEAGLITVVPAMEGKHVVNCPFFEPSTVFENAEQNLLPLFNFPFSIFLYE